MRNSNSICTPIFWEWVIAFELVPRARYRFFVAIALTIATTIASIFSITTHLGYHNQASVISQPSHISHLWYHNHIPHHSFTVSLLTNLLICFSCFFNDIYGSSKNFTKSSVHETVILTKGWAILQPPRPLSAAFSSKCCWQNQPFHLY